MFERLQAGEKIHDAPRQRQTCSHPEKYLYNLSSHYGKIQSLKHASQLLFSKWVCHLITTLRFASSSLQKNNIKSASVNAALTQARTEAIMHVLTWRKERSTKENKGKPW